MASPQSLSSVAAEKLTTMSFSSVLLTIITTSALYVLGTVIYNLFFHPLRKYPGPVLFRAMHITKAWYQGSKQMAFMMDDMHAKYGQVVRISPNELAFSHVGAYNDLYSSKNARGKELEKNIPIVRVSDSDPYTILVAPKNMHTILRRLLSKGFSPKAIEEQLHIIRGYLDILIAQFRKETANGQAVNVNRWFRLFTFDTIAKLTFGDDFGVLETGQENAWVENATQSVGFISVVASAAEIGLGPVIRFLIRNGLGNQARFQSELMEKIRPRIEAAGESPDFVDGLVQAKKAKNAITDDEIRANTEILLMAGADTTAAFLTVFMYNLLSRPEPCAKLTHEIRSTFKNEDEITVVATGQLKYLQACLNETFRLCPIAVHGLPRCTDKGGSLINGEVIPEGTIVSSWSRAMFRHPDYFKDPLEYHPERWLGDPKYEGDRIDIVHPFSVGARDCIGRNLSFAESRMVIAFMIVNFELKVAKQDEHWMDELTAGFVVDHRPLHLHMTPRSEKA